MVTNNSARSMLHLLARHEMQIGAFYRECARQIPDEEEFWTALSQAEAGHAKELSSLLGLADTGGVILRDDAINRDTLDAFSRYTNEQTRIIAYGGMTMAMLLNIALDLEQNLLEQNPFAYFSGDAPELAQVRETLVRETREHIDAIQKKRTRLR